jgi:hypothetical protein
VVIFTFRSFIAGKRASGALGGTQSHSGRLEEERNHLPWQNSGSRDSSAVQCVAHPLCRRGKIVTAGLRYASDDTANYERKVCA